MFADVSKGKTTLLPLRIEKPHGCGFSDFPEKRRFEFENNRM